MKKILIFSLIGLMAMMSNMTCAQFGDYGVRIGLGYATIDDDMTTKSGILGTSLGGYINYNFDNTILEEVLYLQSGVNFIRRGCNFEEVNQTGTNLMIRNGSIHAWYMQIPILVGVHFELPVREVGHTVGFFLGPTVSVGLFGPYEERKVTPFVSSPDANYDLSIHGSSSDRNAFSHINRIDVSALLGLSYEHGDFTFTAYLDHGFIATSTGVDVIRLMERTITNNEDIKVKIPNGSNMAYMFSVAYRLGSIKDNK